MYSYIHVYIHTYKPRALVSGNHLSLSLGRYVRCACAISRKIDRPRLGTKSLHPAFQAHRRCFISPGWHCLQVVLGFIVFHSLYTDCSNAGKACLAVGLEGTRCQSRALRPLAQPRLNAVGPAAVHRDQGGEPLPLTCSAFVLSSLVRMPSRLDLAHACVQERDQRQQKVPA